MKMMKMIQMAFANPPMSWRRKMSMKIMIAIQIHMMKPDEDQHRPEDVQEGIVGSNWHAAHHSRVMVRSVTRYG